VARAGGAARVLEHGRRAGVVRLQRAARVRGRAAARLPAAEQARVVPAAARRVRRAAAAAALWRPGPRAGWAIHRVRRGGGAARGAAELLRDARRQRRAQRGELLARGPPGAPRAASPCLPHAHSLLAARRRGRWRCLRHAGPRGHPRPRVATGLFASRSLTLAPRRRRLTLASRLAGRRTTSWWMSSTDRRSRSGATSGA
jgi:hypothetical protein